MHYHLKKFEQDLELGPAVAPYPPPAPTYPEARDSLIDNEVCCSFPYCFLLIVSSFLFPKVVWFTNNIGVGDKEIQCFAQEAITRLAGKSAKLKEFKDDLKGNIIDINEDDMKVDQKAIKRLKKQNIKYIFNFRATQLTG